MALLEVYDINHDEKWRAEHHIVVNEWKQALVEVEANARLIVAAPEMLEALESFVHLYDDGANFDEAALRKVVNGMRAAIAKAKGQSESLVTSDGKSESGRSEA